MRGLICRSSFASLLCWRIHMVCIEINANCSFTRWSPEKMNSLAHTTSVFYTTGFLHLILGSALYCFFLKINQLWPTREDGLRRLSRVPKELCKERNCSSLRIDTDTCAWHRSIGLTCIHTVELIVSFCCSWHVSLLSIIFTDPCACPKLV